MNKKIENPQKEEMKNMFIAIILVSIIMFIFNPFSDPQAQNQTTEETATVVEATQPTVQNEEVIPVAENQPKAEPVLIENDFIKAYFDPALGGINNLSLLKYKETLDEKSANVQLFNDDYFTSIEWKSKDVQTPLTTSAWVLDTERSTNNKKIFVFQNDDLQIEREILVDDQYLVTIKDTIKNLKTEPVKVYQNASFSRKLSKTPEMSNVHQGFVGYLNNELVEEKYTDKNNIYSGRTKSGWFGFTDKYWQGLMVLNSDENVAVSFSKDMNNTYIASYETDNIVIQPGESVSKSIRLFAGAKDIDIINAYQQKMNIPHFDLSLDFGWFRFLTQPFLHFLNLLHSYLGNMGITIIVFATLIRLALLPIATKSYESMAKMRKIQPKMQVIQRKFQKDPRRMQIEMANLYKREKINPASGCLPLLLQIPVFFALYKVLSISISMRQAPFFGWIQDLSMPDPLTVFNGFGYFDWSVPAFLSIGVWPLLMGITMYIQQKLTPAPADKTQARIMQFLPVIFTLMMASFASGLIIYWTWSNVLSILQQKYIMKKVEAK